MIQIEDFGVHGFIVRLFPSRIRAFFRTEFGIQSSFILYAIITILRMVNTMIDLCTYKSLQNW